MDEWVMDLDALEDDYMLMMWFIDRVLAGIELGLIK